MLVGYNHDDEFSFDVDDFVVLDQRPLYISIIKIIAYAFLSSGDNLEF